MESVFMMAVVGVAVSLVTQLGKRFSLSGRVSLLIAVIAAAIAYQSFLTFVPEELRIGVISFIGQAAGYASLFYGIVLKKIESK